MSTGALGVLFFSNEVEAIVAVDGDAEVPVAVAVAVAVVAAVAAVVVPLLLLLLLLYPSPACCGSCGAVVQLFTSTHTRSHALTHTCTPPPCR